MLHRETMSQRNEDDGKATVPPRIRRGRGRPALNWALVHDELGITDDGEIAERLGCSRETVRGYRHRHGIKKRVFSILPESVDGFGVDRDEVVAARCGLPPEIITERRKQLGIKRPRGLAAQRSRMARVEADPASATADDVAALIEKIGELRRSKDAVRKARDASRLAAEVQTLRCLVWVLLCEEDVDDAPERVRDAAAHIEHRMGELCEQYWEREAARNGHGRGWVEQNVRFDPARDGFINHVLETGAA